MLSISEQTQISDLGLNAASFLLSHNASSDLLLANVQTNNSLGIVVSSIFRNQADNISSYGVAARTMNIRRH